MLMSLMSTPEIEKAIAGGATTAILVAASIEQHGPHLPCESDSIYGTALARRLAAALGQTLVAPPIAPGCSDHHIGFGGTFTITPELLVAQVEARLADLARMGFREAILTSSHGGNFRPLAAATPRLREFAASLNMTLVAIVSLEDFVEALRRAPAERGMDQGLPAVQADLIETSIMLSLRPDLVDMSRAEPGGLVGFTVDELFQNGLRSVTQNGVLGDPRAATAELGEAILASLDAYLLAGVARQRAAA